MNLEGKGNTQRIKKKSSLKKKGPWLRCGLSMIIKNGWGNKGINGRERLSLRYLTGYFGSVSDMYHGRGDLQAWEVLAPHVLLKVLLIVFLLAAKIRQGTDRAQITKQCWITVKLSLPGLHHSAVMTLVFIVWVSHLNVLNGQHILPLSVLHYERRIN